MKEVQGILKGKMKIIFIFWILRLLGYTSLFYEENGIMMFLGTKYSGKGWHKFSISFNNFKPGVTFRGSIKDIVIYRKFLTKKEILRKYEN